MNISDDATKAEARAFFEGIDKAKRQLAQMGLAYPGSDCCRVTVLRGLAALLDGPLATKWDEKAQERYFSETLNEVSAEQQAAIDWLRIWVDAGRSMIR